MTFSDIIFYFRQYSYHYPFLVPLGIIGMWRWAVWVLKEIIGLNYRPKTSVYKGKVSIVTPVYNENPSIFQSALNSWAENNPSEIIAVIDYSDTQCIEVFKKFSKNFARTVLIVTRTPGKRPALADGIKKAKHEIIALVDSDTIWDKGVIKNGLPPFEDQKVAGVGTYQNVLEPKTFAQKIFDVQLDLRYLVEYPFLAVSGDALICLSGRTAFYRRNVILPMLPKLVNETFMGRPVISGDDKTLTYLVLEAGWKVAYQSNSHVYTPGMEDLKSYLLQRLRWSRNALRADIRAIARGWPLRHPALFFFQVDKFMQSIVVVLSPIYFSIALLTGVWPVAFVIFAWWFVSRLIKMYPHLSRNPRHITLLPGFVLYSFLTGFLKIYAFFTLNTQGWITRWDKSRLPQLRFLSRAPAYVATCATIIFLALGIYYYKEITLFIPRQKMQHLVSKALPHSRLIAAAEQATVLGVSTVSQKRLLVNKYVVDANESLSEISKKTGVDFNRLLFANAAKITNVSNIKAGTIINIPGEDFTLSYQTGFEYDLPVSTRLSLAYYKPSNTILAWGRGSQITLKGLAKAGGGNYLKEVSPGIWHSDANIFIHNGVKLTIDKDEVKWLKLESNQNKFVSILTRNTDVIINGVKVTSWDSTRNEYDTDVEDGRSFIMVKDAGRMDIFDSELAYLGFPTSPGMMVSPYGVSWKLSNSKLKNTILTGEVINSKFHDNYFGAYTFGATGMIWRGNEFYSNIKYGLDPHDDSNGFIVEGNKAYSNGSHGIIFSKRCMYNIIRNNITYNNKLHGIMLHEKSDFNIIENNTISGNTSGIALWRSSNNEVRNNVLVNNRHGIRANVNSDENLIEENSVTESTLYGLYFYDDASKNTVRQNIFTKNDVGMYIKSGENSFTNNILSGNRVAVYFLEGAHKNELARNEITDSKKYGIYTKVSKSFFNLLGYNELER
ncbi:right-handed parallel beta-helix repeat-containing protein, partial [Candidatus Roizmanbacteria bacterium]|nr:right-handed parallel beta-helix repeat-containing protein [Candidatus Roizmanbacteria bacterium]